jgi:hypothetical protein
MLGPADALAQIVSPRLSRQNLLPYDATPRTFNLGQPWVPSGAVISFDRAFLINNPLDPIMFWLEMSDWARRFAHPIPFRVLADKAEHRGHSSKTHAATVVYASELSARVAYVKRHGSWAHRAAIPVVVLLGLVLTAARGGIEWGSIDLLRRMTKGQFGWQVVAK